MTSRIPRSTGAARAGASCLLAALALAACGQPDTLSIDDVRSLPKPRRAVPGDVPTWKRFGMRPAAAKRRPALTWKAPDGWTHAPTQRRPFNFAVARSKEIDVYLTALPARGGTVTDNVNRWRKQMGLEPVDDAAVKALPRHPLFGQAAAFLDVPGTYTPMGGGAPKPDMRLLGLLLDAGQEQVFFKLVGPSEAVEAEREHFLQMAASFQRSAPDDAAHAHAQAGMGDLPSTPTKGGRLTWTAPEGWVSEGGRGMREVTMRVSGTDASCWAMFLSSTGGGIPANVNRWRRELGMDSLTAAQVAELPRLDVLGTQGVLVEGQGDYRGMGGTPMKGARLLGLIVPLGGRTLFVKMVGSADAMAGQKERFEQFCRSLGVKQ